MTTREQALIDEITAHGGVEVTDDDREDKLLDALVLEGLGDDREEVRAMLEDMGEDPDEWIDMD